MKKLFLFMLAMVATISMYAQDKKKPLEPQKFHKTMYIGFGSEINGYASPAYNGFEDFKGSIGGGVNVRVGKYLTPVFGMEGDFSLGLPNNDESIHHLDLGLNMLFNANNAIHGFKGKADLVEAVPFLGMGWERYLRANDKHSSDLYGKGGVQVNLNFAEHWQFNVIPYVQYRITESKKPVVQDYPRLSSNNMRVGIEFGFTYKFGNFKFSDLKYTQSEFDGLNDKINEARLANDKLSAQVASLNDDNGKLKSEIDELNKREMTTVENNIMPVVQFEIGKSNIGKTQRAALEQIAIFLADNKDLELTIVGHADAQTGSVDRNVQLSKERAENVKKALVDMGISPKRLLTDGVGSSEQPFSENDSNRVVLFVNGK